MLSAAGDVNLCLADEAGNIALAYAMVAAFLYALSRMTAEVTRPMTVADAVPAE